MKERLCKLLSVKSIVTVISAVIFSILSLRGIITGQQFLECWLIIIGFYFGTQAEKRNGGEKE